MQAAVASTVARHLIVKAVHRLCCEFGIPHNLYASRGTFTSGWTLLCLDRYICIVDHFARAFFVCFLYIRILDVNRNFMARLVEKG